MTDPTPPHATLTYLQLRYLGLGHEELDPGGPAWRERLGPLLARQGLDVGLPFRWRDNPRERRLEFWREEGGVGE